jgi:hypothetical protein
MLYQIANMLNMIELSEQIKPDLGYQLCAVAYIFALGGQFNCTTSAQCTLW